MRQDLTGRTLGHYVIEELLGSGGMGQVYRAVHRMLNRPAAVKVMHPHLAADPTFQARFEREARAAASLDHPNIVGIYDFDEQDGLLYIAMEFVPNGSMRGLLPAHGPPHQRPLRVGIDLVRQAADGLHYAHSRGMIHRDIKPDNLLLKPYEGSSYPDRRHTVVISDFGLARLREGGTLTASGVMMGTPAYMAPEQFQDKELDGRSDIYALGVVLYEVATGYLPFEARTISDAAYKHVHTPPPRPRDVHPDVPDPVEAIILRCLAKSQDDRFPDAASLSAALQSVLIQTDTGAGVAGHSTYVPGSDATSQNDPSPTREPPPFVPTLAGMSDRPRIQVLDQHGRPLQVIEVPDSGLTVGRAESNDVALPGDSLSDHHVRIDLDGDGVRVTDQGSTSGVFLDGVRLPQYVGQPWLPGEWLRVGQYWLWVDPPGVSASIERGQVPDPAISGPIRPSGSGRIYVLVEDDSLDITPGEPTVIRVTVANLGRTVDHLRLDVEGVPGGWVQAPRNEVQLNPGANTQLEIRINVARAPENVAGDYPVTLRATSRANPAESGGANAIWRVAPFRGTSFELVADDTGSRRRDRVRVAIANEGNTPERVTLSGEGHERSLDFRFEQETFVVAPGDSVTVPVDVSAPRRLIGGQSTYRFTIRAEVESGAEHEVEGLLNHSALMRWWVIPVIALVLIPLCVAAFMLFRDGGNGPGQRTPFPVTVVPIPNTPADLTLTLSLTAVTVSWQHDGQDVDHFEVQRSINDGEFEQIAVTRDLGFRDRFDSVPAPVGRIARLTYRVRAISPDGEESPFSREASIEAPIFPSN